MLRKLYIERALFIVGAQNSGKSTQLRSMFLDPRLGLQGNVRKSKKMPKTCSISHERSLYIRMTSPHEYGESPREFFEKIREKTIEGRWSIAAPLQPDQHKKMPDVVETVKKFHKHFLPERIRVCFLSPDRKGIPNHDKIKLLINRLWKIGGVECIVLDARDKNKNSFVYADFFDFT